MRFLPPTDQKCAESSTYWQFFNYRPPGKFWFTHLGKLHPCRHCLHMRTWITILNYFLIFKCKHSQHARHRCHVNMACNPWLETLDVAIIHTGGTRICVTVQWITVDHMTLSPAEINVIGTAAVNSHAMTGDIPNTKPNYCQCTSAALLCN